MPGRYPLLREGALALFLIAVALGLWLAQVRPLVVVAVMALALAIAWTIEWLAWRDLRVRILLAAAQDAEEGEPPDSEEAQLEEPVEAAAAEAPRARRSWYPLRREPAKPERAEEEAPFRPPLLPPASVIEGRARLVPADAPAAEPVGEPAAPEAPAPEAEPRAPAAEPPPVAAPAGDRPPLRPVPSMPTPAVSADPAHEEAHGVVNLVPRGPRTWNLWELERLAREEFKGEALEQSQYLFIHLRQFARADGQLPLEFDELVRDSFGGLLERVQHA